MGEYDTINLEVVVRVINVNYEKGAEIRENDGYLRGKEDGMKKGIIDVAAKMKCSGMSIDQIIQLTELDAEEIEKL